MVVEQYITFKVQVELPDDLDQDEQDVLIESLVNEADFNLQFDNGDGTKIVGDVILHSYTNEEPE